MERATGWGERARPAPVPGRAGGEPRRSGGGGRQLRSLTVAARLFLAQEQVEHPAAAHVLAPAAAVAEDGGVGAARLLQRVGEDGQVGEAALVVDHVGEL